MLSLHTIRQEDDAKTSAGQLWEKSQYSVSHLSHEQ